MDRGNMIPPTYREVQDWLAARRDGRRTHISCQTSAGFMVGTLPESMAQVLDAELEPLGLPGPPWGTLIAGHVGMLAATDGEGLDDFLLNLYADDSDLNLGGQILKAVGMQLRITKEEARTASGIAVTLLHANPEAGLPAPGALLRAATQSMQFSMQWMSELVNEGEDLPGTVAVLPRNLIAADDLQVLRGLAVARRSGLPRTASASSLLGADADVPVFVIHALDRNGDLLIQDGLPMAFAQVHARDGKASFEVHIPFCDLAQMPLEGDLENARREAVDLVIALLPDLRWPTGAIVPHAEWQKASAEALGDFFQFQAEEAGSPAHRQTAADMAAFLEQEAEKARRNTRRQSLMQKVARRRRT